MALTPTVLYQTQRVPVSALGAPAPLLAVQNLTDTAAATPARRSSFVGSRAAAEPPKACLWLPRRMHFRSLMTAVSLLVAFSARAQAPAAGKSDVWGRSPVSATGDDRFSNPKKPLYAGPDGWWNTGEVRATVANAAKTAYTYKANFQLNSGVATYHAVKGEQVLSFDFGSTERPKPGVYTVGAKGNLAQKTVHMSFADVSNKKLLDWSAAAGAGTLTVKLVNGFTYFTCRGLTLQPTGLNNRGELAKPLTIGFEGALSPK